MNIAVHQKENEMNPQNETQDATFNSAYNPFPEPQTIPSGWDYSALTSAPQVDTVEQADDFAESESN
jgi:hypothetical protein